MDDHTPHGHGHGHGEQESGLDLDAEVFGAQLTEVLDLVPVTTPRHVVDLGAGTGTGTRLLRRRFPDARVTAVDNAPEMLARLRGRVSTSTRPTSTSGSPRWATSTWSGRRRRCTTSRTRPPCSPGCARP